MVKAYLCAVLLLFACTLVAPAYASASTEMVYHVFGSSPASCSPFTSPDAIVSQFNYNFTVTDNLGRHAWGIEWQLSDANHGYVLTSTLRENDTSHTWEVVLSRHGTVFRDTGQLPFATNVHKGISQDESVNFYIDTYHETTLFWYSKTGPGFHIQAEGLIGYLPHNFAATSEAVFFIPVNGATSVTFTKLDALVNVGQTSNIFPKIDTASTDAFGKTPCSLVPTPTITTNACEDPYQFGQYGIVSRMLSSDLG